MEMRIVVPDVPAATALAEWLTSVFGTERISFSDGGGEVDIEVDPEPSPAIPRVVEAVVGWFDQARVATVELWLGERMYRLARWDPVERR
jgi:hypothetical protein